jgi:hypothetical protein
MSATLFRCTRVKGTFWAAATPAEMISGHGSASDNYTQAVASDYYRSGDPAIGTDAVHHLLPL